MGCATRLLLQSKTNIIALCVPSSIQQGSTQPMPEQTKRSLNNDTHWFVGRSSFPKGCRSTPPPPPPPPISTERERGTETKRQRQRETHRQSQRETDRQTESQRRRERERETVYGHVTVFCLKRPSKWAISLINMSVVSSRSVCANACLPILLTRLWLTNVSGYVNCHACFFITSSSTEMGPKALSVKHSSLCLPFCYNQPPPPPPPPPPPSFLQLVQYNKSANCKNLH